MKRTIVAVLFVLIVCVVAIGFYRGWFALTSSNVDGSNQTNVNLTVDRDKMKEDATAVKKKSVELTDNVTGGEKSSDDRATDNAKSND